MASPYDALKTLRKLTQPRFPGRSIYSRQGGLTQTQQETLPYLERLKAKEERRGRLLQPVETLFDVLNRGQYVTANIAQQITDNMNTGREWWLGIPNAVKEGLTGARKGDWEKVLFGGELSGQKIGGWIPWRPETTAGKIAKGVAGFGANVLLDPTTYVSFGAATASKGAATKYADDVVKLTLKEIGKNATDVLPKMIQSGYNAKKFGELLAKNAPEGFSYLARYAGDDITKLLSRTWKEAYRTGLRTPAAKLTEDITSRIKNLMQEVTGKEVSTVVKQAPEAFLKEAKQLTGKVAPVSEYDRLAQMLAGVEGGAYAGAGQRAARFMRKEFAVGERYPTWLQVMDQMRGRFQKSKLGGAFSDAWWSVMNSERSPIAKLKKMIRIRNPYQKMLSILERDITYETAASTATKMNKLHQVMEPLSKEQADRVTEAMVLSQVLQEHAKRTGKTPISAEMIVRMRGLDEKDADIVAAAIGKINEITSGWEEFNRWAVSQGVARDMGHWEDYLPIGTTGKKEWRKSGTLLGTARPGWTMPREVGWGKHLKQDIEKLKWMFGLDTETAEKALVEGIGNINIDLQDILMRRAFAQSRFEQHVNMVLQFREFGVNVADLKIDNPEIYQSLAGKWGNLEPLGMKPVHGAPGLEGYLFDREIADIFERSIDVSSNDKGLKSLANVLSSFTSWWRGWATLSPGFHARNFMSNNVTGFLRHGAAWLNPQAHMEAFVATTIALNGPEEGFKKLAQIMPADTVREVLARRIGDKTLGELAEFGGMRGVASRMSMGFTQPKTYGEVAQAGGKLFQGASLSPLSNQFAMFGVSRELGAYIESTAKMQSFLLDYRKAIKQGANAQTAMDWAKTQARFWFLDYGDLTAAERNIGRNIIPFYSWARGNLGVQIVGMMQMPEMYAMVGKATAAARAEGAPEQREFPEWMQELGMIPIAETEEGLYRMFWPNYPYQDINKLPVRFEMRGGVPVPMAQDPWQTISDIAQDAHPLIKNIIEVIGGVDIFYREPLGEVRKAPRLTRVFTKSPGVLSFIDGLMRRIGFEDGLKVDVNDKGQLMMDSKMAKVLEDNIILLERIPQFLDLPEMLVPAIERVKQRVTGAVDDYEGAEEMFQVLSFYLGVKLKGADVEEERFRRNQEMLEEAYAERRRAERYTPQHMQRSLKWQQQQRRTQRKLGL